MTTALYRFWFFVVLLAGVANLGDVACTPAQRADIVKAAPAVERAACFVIRAVSSDGTAIDVCATADELAPLLPDLLAAREAEAGVDPELASRVAFALSSTARRIRVPRRRCVSWEAIEVDSGRSEGGGRESGGGGEAGDGGRAISDGGRSAGDGGR